MEPGPPVSELPEDPEHEPEGEHGGDPHAQAERAGEQLACGAQQAELSERVEHGDHLPEGEPIVGAEDGAVHLPDAGGGIGGALLGVGSEDWATQSPLLPGAPGKAADV